MELLDQTLSELETTSKTLGHLEKYYVRDIYPQFKTELKNIGIPDIDSYEAYTLDNVQADLKHIHMLHEVSIPTENFKKKAEFLVELTQRMLNTLLKSIKQKSKKEILVPRKINLIHPKEEFEKSQREKPIRLPVIQKFKKFQEKELKNKESKVFTKPLLVVKKDEKKSKENIKTKLIQLHAKGLGKISEEVTAEEISDNESQGKTTEPDESEEISWTLPPVQQEMLQSTLQKYNMSEQVWENYILNKIHNAAQFRRMGIQPQKSKIDCSMESLKFVEELE